MTESPPNTVTTPAPLPPADLPAVHATDPSLSSQPTQQPIPESTPPATPLLTSLFPVMPAPLQPGTMVIGRSPEHSLLWVGEILGILPSDGATEGDVRYEVHAWGSHQRYALSCRQWAPGYYSSGGGYVLYNKRASKHAAEIVELSHGQITAAGFEMERSRGNRGFRLPPSLCSHFASGSDGCHFYEYPGARLSDPSVASAVAFLASIDLSVRAATMHQPVNLKHLCPASRQLVCFADQKEDQGWIDREVYIRTPISEVPRNIALDACKRRGVDLSLYLQAPLPPDRPPPPSDHPDHGQFLWVLRKAVYGLPDAGKVFEDFLTSVLRSLGWEPTLFPGVWVLRSANGELRALLATYCDDLLILGIGEDAAATIDPLKDIVTYGDYTNLSEGRFVGVQFDVSTTGVCESLPNPARAANVLSLLLFGASSSAEHALLPIIREMQDKACVVPLQAATDLVEQHRIGIFKIPTDSNLSDLLTKALDLGALTRLISPSPSLFPVFGSEIVSFFPPLALRDRPTMEKERRGDGEELTT
uniref:Reverse transcriptase Ty1/copia-type domain-containing protein n=1 Tax=Chromera velia CCMP2878 TaxID=1169474 RepID=A0A0G4IDL2_9ALVE|eukprot:Cvel_13331.t1-p1 / transcript=Cvel_13331.t1 / gene=Cvel_13331 / organism=Chromera_velia_CCMP2878 / gene_product=hypothetical protein / transcript_product=hypothetical protein / location=Cvel_scaffold905:42661-44982(-) / protein_length=531 / sequence_SO=supercontig / SO=protein_coding / is_pseudo=false